VWALFVVVAPRAARLPDPEPGEWLAVFDEPGQTLDEFRAEVRTLRRTKDRDTIHLVPLGSFRLDHPELLKQIADYARVFFGAAVRIEPDYPLLEETYRSRRKQYDAERILDLLRKSVPKNAFMRVALTDQDLTSGHLNFVFGVGSLTERVGVYSVFRLRDPAPPTTLLRTLKVVNHEMGHLLGIRHCIFYRCSMNGTNSVPELDRQPVHFCGLCRTKLVLATGVELVARDQGLTAFYRRHGLADAARSLAGQEPLPQALGSEGHRDRD
jgi:archaemetzincin